MALLAINAGSTSVKAAWFAAPGQGAAWRIEVQHQEDEPYGFWSATGEPPRTILVPQRPGGGCEVVLQILRRRTPDRVPSAPDTIVHRVVHGGTSFRRPVEVDDLALAALAALTPLAPLHQPDNLAGIAVARAQYPAARQVACFDTAFHAGWPDAAQRFALPRRLHEQGIRRYGFHGLAHAHAARALRAMLPQARRAVIAHLGGGSSLCALAGFESVDCSMGYSPLDGLPMATRCGAIDPGVLLDLAGPRGMPLDVLQHLLYRESGMRGVSGVSAHMHKLLESAAPAAREAVDLYVHHLVRGIGAMAATLGGLDALVFSGGIGEHAAPIRAAACARLGFLGVDLDPAANAAHAPVLESTASRVAVRIVACDEEAEMAREAFALLDGAPRE